MAETLPTETTYTLRDILELLEYRVNYAAFEQRRQRIQKPVYTDLPGNPASSQFHNAFIWSTFNCPQPGRLSEQHASTIPLYRRLLRTARRDYESDLTPAILPVILCDAIAGTSKTLAEVWNMPADEFERFWTAPTSPKRGAPRKSDPTDDDIIVDAWKRFAISGTKADFCKEFPQHRLTVEALNKLINRRSKAKSRART